MGGSSQAREISEMLQRAKTGAERWLEVARNPVHRSLL